jgi:acetylornithine/LysW-gamma-L-lysine aminotransferase
MFAYQHADLKPDLVCLAKSIAGGVPMGAVLIGKELGDLSPGIHGSTFGGNPLACAAALATLDVFERDHLAEQAAALGSHVLQRLKRVESPLIREVRGLGLLVGIELRKKAAPYLNALMERGILALNAGSTVIRLLPPLVITKRELDQVVDGLQIVLAENPI